MANKKCPICKKILVDIKALGSHIEKKHSDELPKDWSGVKYNFYLTHGRVEGKCHVCKKPTKFNEVTGKPEFFCGNPKCKDAFVKNFENNMIRVHGKARLLDDPEYQEKKMLANRGIAKKYKWSDGSYKTCIGSFEYEFAQFLDVFMNFPSNDVMFPAPMIIKYMYEDKERFYIPDVYIGSLNLIVEIKDGGDQIDSFLFNQIY